MRKQEKIKEMFDSISDDYDKLNHIMSFNIDRVWRKKALEYVIDSKADQEIMDLACGTGDFSIAIAERMGPGSHVTGVDISEGMLDVMKRKVSKAGLDSRISIETGEGSNLRFGDGSFDVVTIAFGIRNFEDRENGLREILRVLKPGGKLVILELSEPENKIIKWCYNLYFNNITPFIGRIISGNGGAYRYLPASVKAFPHSGEWMKTMHDCGYINVIHNSLTFGICRLYIGQKR